MKEGSRELKSGHWTPLHQAGQSDLWREECDIQDQSEAVRACELQAVDAKVRE